jgi:hypothetical protein
MTIERRDVAKHFRDARANTSDTANPGFTLDSGEVERLNVSGRETSAIEGAVR